jgi:hypothetical protein
MFFDDCIRNLHEAPKFAFFDHLDVNPHSGNKKMRRIYAPNPAMRLVHRRLVKYLRSLKIEMPNATGARPGSSPLKNVVRHRRFMGNVAFFPQFFFLTDISGAYQSVSLEKLTSILAERAKVADTERDRLRSFLQEYCMAEREGGIIVGAPASPDLFNLYCEALLDVHLRGLCEQYKIVYTRYLDDLTFSSPYTIGKKKRRKILRTVRDAGFEISNKKTQVLDLAKDPAVINGIGIEQNGRLFLPRRILVSMQGKLHQAYADRVSMNRVHGLVGALVAISKGKALTTSEQKVLESYRTLKDLREQEREREVRWRLT